LELCWLFLSTLDIPFVGLSRVDKKIALTIRDPIILIPENIQLSYQLKFQKAEWIDFLILTIYEDSMPLNYSPDAASIPNVFASSATSATIPISATSVSLLAANANRKKMIISNNSNQDLYIDFDAAAAVADHAIKIPKVTSTGFIATYELDEYTGVVSGIWAAAGSGAALVREMVA
jgi:hypothetical protein